MAALIPEAQTEDKRYALGIQCLPRCFQGFLAGGVERWPRRSLGSSGEDLHLRLPTQGRPQDPQSHNHGGDGQTEQRQTRPEVGRVPGSDLKTGVR